MKRAMVAVAPVSETPTPRLPGWRSTIPGGLLRTARPKQWLKNVLVFAAAGAAGVLAQAEPLARSALAFAMFCLVASGTYFLNDTFDLAADRLHPTKRLRPIAAGVIPVSLARFVGVGLAVAGLGLSFILGWRFALVVAIYLAVQVAYSVWLKHEPIFDLAAVAAGFVLRAIAGGLAVRVPISQWFLIVATFGSLFMVTGKRSAELGVMGEDSSAHRATLAVYTPTFLRSILITSSAVAIAAYCLWAFENQKALNDGIWFQLSIVPFVLGTFRYGLLLDQGHGGQPEDVLLSDRTLQVLAVLWLGCFALGAYA